MRAVGNGIECLGHFSVVVQRLFQRGAAGDELFQVSTRRKGLVASAAQHDAADARVGADARHVGGNLLPHGQIDGIQLVRIV